jgi:hypothetical protein
MSTEKIGISGLFWFNLLASVPLSRLALSAVSRKGFGHDDPLMAALIAVGDFTLDEAQK